MDWIQAKIITTNEGIEPICGALYELGITGIEISDKEDFKEFLENNRKYWDYVDEEFDLAGQYKVVSIPTLMVLNNGVVEDRALGARPKKQILAMLG